MRFIPKISSFSLAFVLMLLACGSARIAQAAESVKASETGVEISAEKYFAAGKDTLSFGFTLKNSKSYTIPAYYVIVFEPKQVDFPAFTQVIRQPLSIASGTDMPIAGVIQMPHFLAGEYLVFAQIQAPSGAVLANGTGSVISFVSTSTIGLKGCLSGSNGLFSDDTFFLDENQMLPEIMCIVTSKSDDKSGHTYTFTSVLNEYTVTGKEMDRKTVHTTIGGTQEIPIRFPASNTTLRPGKYTLTFEIRNDRAELVTVPLVAPVQVNGTGAKILAVRPDAAQYVSGDVAKLDLSLVPTPADPQDGSILIQAEMKDLGGSCGTSQSFSWATGKSNEIRIPVNKNCSAFQVIVTAKDSDGKILDTLTDNFGYASPDAAVPSTVDNAASSTMSSKVKVAILILAGLVIVGLGWYLIRRHRNETRY